MGSRTGRGGGERERELKQAEYVAELSVKFSCYCQNWFGKGEKKQREKEKKEREGEA